MENFVVTIARGYGSGGKTIGKMLAKELGVEYYDQDLIKLASEESGIHEGLFGQADEKVKKSFFINKKRYKNGLLSPKSKGFVSDENLFNYQAKVIKELADKGNCIIGYAQSVTVKVLHGEEKSNREEIEEIERKICERDD